MNTHALPHDPEARGLIELYGALGWRMFPVQDKKPYLKAGTSWQDAATTDPDVLCRALARCPADVGIAITPPDGWVILDFDDEGLFAEFERGGLVPEAAPVQQTPRGGRHVVVFAPWFGGQASPVPGRLDVRLGGKGYVVAAPTQGYRWIVSPEDGLDRDACALDEAEFRHFVENHGGSLTPAHATAHATSGFGCHEVRAEDFDPAYARAALEQAADRIRQAVPGTRNNTLNAEAFAVARFIVTGALDEEAVIEALLEAGRDAGLGLGESAKTVASAVESRLAAEHTFDGLTIPRDPADLRRFIADHVHTSLDLSTAIPEPEAEFRIDERGQLWDMRGREPRRLTTGPIRIVRHTVVFRPPGSDEPPIDLWDLDAPGLESTPPTGLRGSDLARSDWLLELAPRVVPEVGPSKLWAALRATAEGVEEVRRFQATGWHKLPDGTWHYATGDEVHRPPTPVGLLWPDPSDREPFSEGDAALVREALDLCLSLGVADPEYIPTDMAGAVLGATFGSLVNTRPRAPVHIYGSTQAGKTITARLLSYGWFASEAGDVSSSKGQVAWSSTQSALVRILSLSRHMPVVIDELKKSAKYDTLATARDVMTAAFNGAYRERCRTDGSLIHQPPPYAAIVSTGEEAISGQSNVNRTISVPVRRLVRARRFAEIVQTGALARFTWDVVQTLSRDLEGETERYLRTAAHFRGRLAEKVFSHHAVRQDRTLQSLGDLGAGLALLLRHAARLGVLSKDEAQDRLGDVDRILLDLYRQAVAAEDEEDRVALWFDLLISGLRNGDVTFQCEDGLPPRYRSIFEGVTWLELGASAGAVQKLGDRWVLAIRDANLAHGAVLRHAHQAGIDLDFSFQSLARMLRDRGLLYRQASQAQLQVQVRGLGRAYVIDLERLANELAHAHGTGPESDPGQAERQATDAEWYVGDEAVSGGGAQ